MKKNNYKIVFEKLKETENLTDENFDNSSSEISLEELSEISEVIKLSNELRKPEPKFSTTTL